jgi:hypothetical protein
MSRPWASHSEVYLEPAEEDDGAVKAAPAVAPKVGPEVPASGPRRARRGVREDSPGLFEGAKMNAVHGVFSSGPTADV